MMGLVISYIFMGLFGFSYYLSTSNYQTKLEQANLQQSLLLKEIHHRVKNNLNIVSSMLGIQQMSEEDRYIVELMKKNRLRIESIAMIHEILYKHDDFSKINLSDYLQQLLDAIKVMYSDDMKVFISENNVSLALDIVLKLGIITNELAINSLKHAFKDRDGIIEINFKVKNETLMYIYSDNGTCVKENKEEIWKHANLGLKLIKMMLQQINAKVELLPTEGLSYKIEVPL
jgi:two-component sensor histidine kinase